MEELFQSWIAGFMPQQIKNGRLSSFESDIARYIRDSTSTDFTSATIPLFLHYRGICTLNEQRTRQELIAKFMVELRQHATDNTSLLTLALMAYCFDHASTDIALVSPNGWSLNDLVTFLEHIPVGLKRWTWEKETGRTRNSNPVKWLIENEYHVQNLLYVFLHRSLMISPMRYICSKLARKARVLTFIFQVCILSLKSSIARIRTRAFQS